MGRKAQTFSALESDFKQDIAGKDLGGQEDNMKMLGTQSRAEWNEKLERSKDEAGLLHEFSESQFYMDAISLAGKEPQKEIVQMLD